DFVGKLKKRRIKVPFDDMRKLVEIGDKLQEFRVMVNVMAGALQVSGKFALDLFAALGRPDDHAIGTQLLLVVGEIRHLDLRLAEKTVATRHPSRRDAAEGELEGLAVKHANEPTDRTNKARALETGPRHGARPGQVMYRPWQNFEQQFMGASATLDDLSGK